MFKSTGSLITLQTQIDGARIIFFLFMEKKCKSLDLPSIEKLLFF
jgi:hypothetical protein